MFEFEACEVLKAKESTFVNDWFQYERNEEIGHYRQSLINQNNQLSYTKKHPITWVLFVILKNDIIHNRLPFRHTHLPFGTKKP